MKNLIYILTLIAFLVTGCTELDEEVYEKIPEDEYPENEAQIASLPAEVYAQLKPLADDQGWWFLAQEISSDEMCGPTRGPDWDDGGKWREMHQHDWSNDHEGVNRMWDKLWSGITTANQTLDLMRKLPQSETVKAKMKEVEVMRSLYYYYLMDNYGAAPYLTSAENAPDKPYKAKRSAIYDSLVTTVKENLPALKAIDNKYMATRYMGYALLAKLYLNAEVYTGTPQWEKASQYCDSVMTGPYSLENNVSAPFVTNNQNSSEIIFSIPYDEDNFQGFRLHMRTLHYQHNLKYNMPVGPWNGFAVVPTFFDTYSENDVRKDAYHIYGPQLTPGGDTIIDKQTEEPLIIDPYLPKLHMTSSEFSIYEIRTTGARIGKYEIKMGAKENLSNDLPLFRLTDIYLMKAEAEIRQGNSGDQWVDPIRERAGVPDIENVTLEELLAERGRELYAEGHRRQDLIRFGEFTKQWWAKGDAQGGVTGDPSVTTFPIPKWATDANPNLLEEPK